MGLGIAVAVGLGYLLYRASQRKGSEKATGAAETPSERANTNAPLVYENCVVHRITSDEGLKYKVIVSLPHSYHHAEAAKIQYPVVFALDAEPYLFPLLTTVARTEHFFKRTTWYPDLIVVAGQSMATLFMLCCPHFGFLEPILQSRNELPLD